MKLQFAIKRLEDMAGGAERVILQVIGGLVRDYGHDITLVTFDRKGASSFYPVPEGVRWVQLGIGDSSQRAGYIETIKRIFSLRRVVKDIAPDVVIPFQHSMFVPMVLSLLGVRVPIIASEHIVPDHYKTRKMEYILLVATGLLCRKITVLSDKIIQMYPSWLRSRMVAVPNPVMDGGGSCHKKGQSENVLLSIGRLDPQKDQKTLIEAFSLICKSFPDWRLRIVGEGLLRDGLELQIKKLGLEEKVSLPGITKDIAREYSQATIFVLPSVYESFGLATVEAMSFGLPTVGFADCPGTNEIIVPELNGILVRTDGSTSRSGALAEALSRLMQDEDLRVRLGAQGRDSVSMYSAEKIVSQWNDLILQVSRS